MLVEYFSHCFVVFELLITWKQPEVAFTSSLYFFFSSNVMPIFCSFVDRTKTKSEINQVMRTKYTRLAVFNLVTTVSFWIMYVCACKGFKDICTYKQPYIYIYIYIIYIYVCIYIIYIYIYMCMYI